MNRKPEEIERICKELLSGYYNNYALNVTLEEFQKFYTTMVFLTKTNPIVSFVNLQYTVVAQFSSISPQHFDIFNKKGIVTENNFDFVISQKWYGIKGRPQRFSNFLWHEFLLNWGKLSTIFIVSAVILFVVNDKSFYEQLISLLIQSATVFLSLYIIFTVSQSQTLYKDIELLKDGILQRYYSDDRHVTLLGIITIAFTFLGSGIIELTNKFDSFSQLSWVPMTMRCFRAITIAIVITMLFDTFFTVANYYLFRNRDVLERDMVADLLHDDYRKYGIHGDGKPD